MIDLYGPTASFAAAQRADKALDRGDMFNFELWKRITKAAAELERKKPSAGEPTN